MRRWRPLTETADRDTLSGAGHVATAHRAVIGRGTTQKRGLGALQPERPERPVASDLVTPLPKLRRGGTAGAGSRPGHRDRAVVENSQWDRRGKQLLALGHAMTIYLDDAARLRVCPTGEHRCCLRLRKVACRPCTARATASPIRGGWARSSAHAQSRRAVRDTAGATLRARQLSLPQTPWLASLYAGRALDHRRPLSSQ